MDRLEETKQYIINQIEENPLVIEFIKNADIDDFLSLGNTLTKLNAVNTMSLFDYNVLIDCVDKCNIEEN